MKYRSEIDGLRTLAVMPVLLFHAKVPGFGGGYVGVDIFFVISGFLITGILLEDLRNDRFSILTFYERRARRILPALIVVALAAFAGAYAVMTPDLFRDFGKSLVALALFVSNILFWWQSGYFEPTAEDKPLLHTWSLAVEEQFYIFFPLLLFLLWRISRRQNTHVATLGVVALLSLAASQWLSASAPTANFYLLPTRIWELMIGAIAVIMGAPQLSSRVQAWLTWSGLAAIAVSIIFYSEATPFPSLYALLPAIGTVAVLLCANSTDYPGRLLSTPIFVGIGLISYSLYLWHQPLLAFYRIYMGADATVAGMVVAVILSIPLAYFSWRYIEAPFRKPAARGGFSQKSIFTMSIIGLGVIAAIGGLIVKDAIRLPYSIPANVTQSFARLKPADNCFDVAGSHRKPEYLCSIGDRALAPDFLLIGDSHALSLKAVFDDTARETGHAGLFVGYSGCPPLLGLRPHRTDQSIRDCQALVRRAFDDAARRGIKTIILVGRWDYYVGDGAAEAGDDTDIQYLGDGDAPPAATLNQNRALFSRALDRTVAFAAARGIRLHILAQVPQQLHSPQSIYYAATRDGMSALREQSISEARYLDQIRPASALFERAEPARRGFFYHAVAPILCGGGVCPIGEPGRSYYFDDDHLSLVGAARLQPVATAILSEH